MTYAKTPTGKNPKGVPSVETVSGRLRIRFRLNGAQKAFSLGLSDNQVNRARAESIARQMQLDLVSGNFDESLAKYKPTSHLQLLETPKTKAKPLIKELWAKYCEYKRPQIQETTFITKHEGTWKSHFEKLPHQDIDDAVVIRDYFLSVTSPYQVKQLLIQLNACCRWAIDSGLIENNPFLGMAGQIKVKTSKPEDIDPFSREERDAIIRAFRESKHFNYYTSFVRFLFLTGCRIGEAIGLRWKNVTSDCKHIYFCESITEARGKFIRKSTKTNRATTFPCNAELQELLLSIRPENPEPEGLVFISKRGKNIDSGNFNNSVWNEGILSKLVEQGLVTHYRSVYHTRHTFITMCLEKGIDAKDIARWVRTSPKKIYEHYAGGARDILVPEL
jgi:integrase